MKPEKIRGYMQDERELRERIAHDQATYEAGDASRELSLEERFTALCERFEALPGMRSVGYDNKKTAEMLIPEADPREVTQDSLRLHLTISYGLFDKDQDRYEADGEVVCLIATWRDPFAAKVPLLEQYVFAGEPDDTGMSILEDSVVAAEESLTSAV